VSHDIDGYPQHIALAVDALKQGTGGPAVF
jgi:hypothetical protein